MNCSFRFTPPSPRERRFHEALGLDPSQKVVLYHGGLFPWRGIEQLIEAIPLVPGATLVLMGYGILEPTLKAWEADPATGGKVRVMGAVPPDQLHDWVASADVAAMPIQGDTLNHRLTTPQKLFEAMAAGVPAVVSDLPGMRAIVNETGSGILVDPTDTRAIADAITRIVQLPEDEWLAWRQRCLDAAHERYNWETQVQALLDEYGEAHGQAVVSDAATGKPAQRRRAVILVGNPANPYSRAIRIGRTLAANGYDVEIAAPLAEGTAEREEDGPLVIRRYRAERHVRPAGRDVPGTRAQGGAGCGTASVHPAARPPPPALHPDADPADGPQPLGDVVPVAAHGPRLVAHARARARAGRPLPRLRRARDPRRARGAETRPPGRPPVPGDPRRHRSPARVEQRPRHARRRSGGCSPAASAAGPAPPTRTPRSTSRSRQRAAHLWRLSRVPIVVPNYPEPWTPPAGCAPPDRIRALLGLPATDADLPVLGPAGPYVGLDEMAEAVLLVPDAVLVVMGFGRGWDASVARDADPRFAGRHFTIPAVHPDELVSWIASADVALVTLPPLSYNQRFTTPNKFLEALAAGTPIVLGPDLPTMAGILEREEAGARCRVDGPRGDRRGDPLDPRSAARRAAGVARPARRRGSRALQLADRGRGVRVRPAVARSGRAESLVELAVARPVMRPGA